MNSHATEVPDEHASGKQLRAGRARLRGVSGEQYRELSARVPLNVASPSRSDH